VEGDSVELYRSLGQRIRMIRKDAGLTQGQLADHLGLNRSSIANAEAGNQHLPLHLIVRLAEKLEVHPSVLLFPDAHPAFRDTILDELTVGQLQRALRALGYGLAFAFGEEDE